MGFTAGALGWQHIYYHLFNINSQIGAGTEVPREQGQGVKSDTQLLGTPKQNTVR